MLEGACVDRFRVEGPDKYADIRAHLVHGQNIRKRVLGIVY